MRSYFRFRKNTADSLCHIFEMFNKILLSTIPMIWSFYFRTYSKLPRRYLIASVSVYQTTHEFTDKISICPFVAWRQRVSVYRLFLILTEVFTVTRTCWYKFISLLESPVRLVQHKLLNRSAGINNLI